MIKPFITLVLLIFSAVCNTSFAQKEVIFLLRDNESKEAIPYGYLTTTNKKSIVYANELGVVKAKVSSRDTVTVSCTGYMQQKFVNVNSSDTLFVHLKHKHVVLDEAIITSESKVKTIPYTTQKPDVTFGANASIELARRVKFPPEDSVGYKRITAVKMKIKRANENNPCRLHVYSAVDGKPGKELLNDNIIISRDNIKRRELVVDLDEYNIVVDNLNIFVGIEWIGKPNLKLHTNPRLGITHQEEEVNTYTRTVGHPEWVGINLVIPDYSGPPNMLVSIEYY